MSSPIPITQRNLGGEPVTAQGFLLKVGTSMDGDAREIGLFMEISGLEMSVGVEEHQEGGVNGYTHKLPGRVSWQNITLTRGLTQSDTLMSWIAQSDTGGNFDVGRSKVQRTSAAISIIDRDANPLRTWVLHDVFPVRWSGPSLSISNANLMTESLELAHHGFHVADNDDWYKTLKSSS